MPGLQPLSTVILESKKIKSVSVSTFSSSVCHEVIGLDLSFLNAEFKANFYTLLFIPVRCRGSSNTPQRASKLLYLVCFSLKTVLLVQPAFQNSAKITLQFSSVAQSRPTLCDPMNRSTPGLPVHHHLPEFTQTHVHRVGDAIQPSHPLSSPSPPAPNPSQHQSLFQ